MFFFYDMTIAPEDKEWLTYLHKKYPFLLSHEAITDAFTEIRQQTAIDTQTGVTQPHSLRTIRVIKEGIKFISKIEILENPIEPWLITLLSMACKNFRHIGTKRNRGFGSIECKQYDEQGKETLEKLEELCKD